MIIQRDTHARGKMKHKVNTLMWLVSLHVSIVCRHAVEATNGVESTEEDPYTIKEHLFVITDDPSQDHDSVHHIQELINRYLTQDLECYALQPFSNYSTVSSLCCQFSV